MDKRTIQGLREGLWDRSDSLPFIAVAMRSRARKSEDELAWRQAILKEETLGYVDIHRPMASDPKAGASIPIIFRPTMV